ncbi:MAG: TOMM precursor leader peptide-binding protein [Marmoricola sp.]
MTRRPVLAPGLPVLHRSSTELQIGRTERYRLRIDDSPAVRRTLAVLDRGETPRSDTETRRVLTELAPVLRDGDALFRPGVPPTEVAAVTLRHPTTAAARLAGRQAARVLVEGDLVVDPRPLLALSALGPAVNDPGVVLLLSRGEADRDRLDQLLRDRTPHLLVRAIESEVVLGPFVVPGRTACVRCLDLHRAGTDPLHPSLVSARAETPRHDGVPEPVDAALAAIALGWAVRDLAAYAEGDRPSTWSATVRLTVDGTSFATTGWLRHPHCGCSWIEPAPGTDDDEDRSVTIGR